MAESMYDRLGDMLSQVLDTGVLPPPLPGQDHQPKQMPVVPEKVREAFLLLEISDTDSYETAHTRYREKIQRHHPDKFENNSGRRQNALQMTKDLISAWAVAGSWLQEHGNQTEQD